MPPDHMHNIHLGLVRQMAEQWFKNWLLFYSIFVLKGNSAPGVLPALVNPCNIHVITTGELKRCEKKMVVDFVKKFEILYGKQNVSFNVHLCLR